ATFGGNDTFRPSTSPPFTVHVLPSTGPDATNITLSSSVNPSVTHQPTTLSVNVASGTGGSQPTGNVTFKNGNAALQTVSLDSSGNASYTTTFTAGSHALSAVYGGDATYAANNASLTELTDQVATSTIVT